MKLVEIAVVTKPQGLKGQFRAALFVSDFSLVENLKKIYINGGVFNVINVFDRGSFVVFELKEFSDISHVENLRGAKIFANKSDFLLGENEILASDVLGFFISTTAGERLGQVVEIANYGTGNVYTIKNGADEFLFTDANGAVLEINEKSKTVLVDEKLLEEVKVV